MCSWPLLCRSSLLSATCDCCRAAHQLQRMPARGGCERAPPCDTVVMSGPSRLLVASSAPPQPRPPGRSPFGWRFFVRLDCLDRCGAFRAGDVGQASVVFRSKRAAGADGNRSARQASQRRQGRTPNELNTRTIGDCVASMAPAAGGRRLRFGHPPPPFLPPQPPRGKARTSRRRTWTGACLAGAPMRPSGTHSSRGRCPST